MECAFPGVPATTTAISRFPASRERERPEVRQRLGSHSENRTGLHSSWQQASGIPRVTDAPGSPGTRKNGHDQEIAFPAASSRLAINESRRPKRPPALELFFGTTPVPGRGDRNQAREANEYGGRLGCVRRIGRVRRIGWIRRLGRFRRLRRFRRFLGRRGRWNQRACRRHARPRPARKIKRRRRPRRQ